MVTARTVLTGTSDGKRFTSAFRFTDTFRRNRGRWHMPSPAVSAEVWRKRSTVTSMVYVGCRAR
jgi:hypothetical protein